LELPHFNRDVIMNKSKAAAGLCDWAINIVKYFDVVIDVAPKKAELAEANAKLADANETLTAVMAKVAELNKMVADLQAQFDEANDEKNAAIKEQERCDRKLDLANRLITALASEGERWAATVEQLKLDYNVLTGDMLLASAFVSYAGPFTSTFRKGLNSEFLAFLKQKGTPMTEGLTDPLKVLVDEAMVAQWVKEGLPSDPTSVQNGTILDNSERWPLIMDPQLQGIVWIKDREAKNGLKVVRMEDEKKVSPLIGGGHAHVVGFPTLNSKHWLCPVLSTCMYLFLTKSVTYHFLTWSFPAQVGVMERAIEAGESVLIENMAESIDAVLNPIITRSTFKKGRSLYVKLGDKDVEYNPKFRLVLHTKLSNPHYPPEIQAETTLINFTVTEAGLEDQLLALTVNKERPDLEATKTQLVKQNTEFTIRLKQLEDDLLMRLSTAEGDLTEDVALIESLEESKRIADDITIKVAEAKETEKMIMVARDRYRGVAARGAMLFFLLNSLNKIHAFYQFSLNAFVAVQKAKTLLHQRCASSSLFHCCTLQKAWLLEKCSCTFLVCSRIVAVLVYCQ
jgi:dynein heavy chain, axonemal